MAKQIKRTKVIIKQGSLRMTIKTDRFGLSSVIDVLRAKSDEPITVKIDSLYDGGYTYDELLKRYFPNHKEELDKGEFTPTTDGNWSVLVL